MSVWIQTAAVYSKKNSVPAKRSDDLAFGYGLNEKTSAANSKLPTANSPVQTSPGLPTRAAESAILGMSHTRQKFSLAVAD